MPDDEIHARLVRLQQCLMAFHRAVARAHARAAARILRRALRELEWLGLLAHETAQDAWLEAGAVLQEYLAGLRPALPDIGGCAAEVARRVERAQAYWQPPHFAEAAADVLSRTHSTPEDLVALEEALRTFFGELARAAKASDTRDGRPREASG